MAKRSLLIFLLVSMASGCGEAGEAPPLDDLPPLGSCATDSDCPEGLTCVESTCVADDGLPPETPPVQRSLLPPVSSEGFLWTLSPEEGRVSAIETSRLAVRSISVPAEPVSVAAIPGEDRVLVLSRLGMALTEIEMRDMEPLVRRNRLARRLSSIALSPDGKWALLWNPEGSPLDAGLEGLIQLVEVESLSSEAVIHERMVGRRPTSVHFRVVDGEAVDAVVVSKDEVALLDLQDLDANPIPFRLEFEALYAEPTTRRVVGTTDGAHLVVGTITSPDLLLIDVEGRSSLEIPLSGPPSDLAFLPSDETIVAVLRSEGKVAWFPLSAPGAIEERVIEFPYEGCEEPPCLASPGQVRMGQDGTSAFFFTNASRVAAFAKLDLTTEEVETFDSIRKPIRDLVPSPRGDRALVFHEPISSTRADAYEKWVDESEGYSLVDVGTGATQLRLTGEVAPRSVVFARGERFAGVTLRDDSTKTFGVDAIDLESLVPFSLSLPSPPEDGGALVEEGKIWISQKHPLGRLSFLDLTSRSMMTITGYDFNARIE